MSPLASRRLVLGLGAALLACGREPPPLPPPLPEASEVELTGATGPLEGAVAGRAFRALDARFRVVTYEGRERVDLIFADRAIERCGLPIARAESRVWLRVSGVTMLAPGLLARLPEPSEVVIAPFEIHYESPVGARYVEAHRAVARLEITAVTSESVDGRLSACFADVARSCVRGSFHATPCRSRIDGRALREPPGLADEALEPIAASSPEAEP